MKQSEAQISVTGKTTADRAFRQTAVWARQLATGIKSVAGGTPGLKRLGGAFGDVARSLKNVVATGAQVVSTIGQITGIATIAGLAGFTAAINAASQSLDDLAALSDTIGIPVQKLRELRLVAKLQNVEWGNMAGALKQSAKGYAEVKAGVGRLPGTLAKMNPEWLAQIKGAKNTTEAFNAMMRIIHNVKDEGTRIKLATMFFGDPEIARIAAMSAKEARDAMKEARDIEGIIDPKSIKNLTDFNDDVDRFNASLGATAEMMAAELLPQFDPWIKDLTEWVKLNRKEWVTNISDSLKSIVRTLRNQNWKEWRDWLGDVWKGAKEAARYVGGFKNVLIALAAIPLLPFALAVGVLAKDVVKLTAALAATPIGRIALLAAALAAVVAVNWDEIKPKLEVAKNAAKDAAEHIGALPEKIKKGDYEGAKKALGEFFVDVTHILDAFQGIDTTVTMYLKTQFGIPTPQEIKAKVEEAGKQFGVWFNQLDTAVAYRVKVELGIPTPDEILQTARDAGTTVNKWFKDSAGTVAYKLFVSISIPTRDDLKKIVDDVLAVVKSYIPNNPFTLLSSLEVSAPTDADLEQQAVKLRTWVSGWFTTHALPVALSFDYSLPTLPELTEKFKQFKESIKQVISDALKIDVSALGEYVLTSFVDGMKRVIQRVVSDIMTMGKTIRDAALKAFSVNPLGNLKIDRNAYEVKPVDRMKYTAPELNDILDNLKGSQGQGYGGGGAANDMLQETTRSNRSLALPMRRAAVALASLDNSVRDLTKAVKSWLDSFDMTGTQGAGDGGGYRGGGGAGYGGPALPTVYKPGGPRSVRASQADILAAQAAGEQAAAKGGYVPPSMKSAQGRAAYAMQRLMAKGWSREAAAGIVGNLQHESGGFSDDVLNFKRRGDKGTAWGLAQWRGDRARGLFDFAKQQGKDARSFDLQIDYVDKELRTTHKKFGDILKRSKGLLSAINAGVMYEGPRGSQHGPTYGDAYLTRAQLARRAYQESIATREAPPVRQDNTRAQAIPQPMGKSQVEVTFKPSQGMEIERLRARAAQNTELNTGVDNSGKFRWNPGMQ